DAATVRPHPPEPGRGAAQRTEPDARRCRHDGARIQLARRHVLDAAIADSDTEEPALPHAVALLLVPLHVERRAVLAPDGAAVRPVVVGEPPRRARRIRWRDQVDVALPREGEVG